MPQFKQIKAEPAVNSGTKGSFCRYERMQALFVASPLYNDYKDDAIEKLGHQKLFVKILLYFSYVSYCFILKFF